MGGFFSRVFGVFGEPTVSCSVLQGNTPSPRAAHACATVGNRGYVFGGRYKVKEQPVPSSAQGTSERSLLIHTCLFRPGAESPAERPVLHRPGHVGVARDVSDPSPLRHGSVALIVKVQRTVFVRSVPQQGPVGRSWHSFTPVSSDHIFLFGGFTTDRETLSESGLLERKLKNP